MNTELKTMNKYQLCIGNERQTIPVVSAATGNNCLSIDHCMKSNDIKKVQYILLIQKTIKKLLFC